MIRWSIAVSLVALTTAGALAVSAPQAAKSPGTVEYAYPAIADHGGAVLLPDAVEQPRAGSKIVFDVTAEGPANEINKGLDRIARYLNLNAGHGVKPERIEVAAVFHGGATKVVLNDAAYERVTNAKKNPNLELIRRLKAAGVEFSVCGQALSHRGYERGEVVDDVPVAVAALMVLVNKQNAGYAFVPIQ